MLTIKRTQTDGAVSILETKTVCILLPETEAWREHRKENPELKMKDMRAIVLFDGGTICVFKHDKHLYIVNENGKTVQTV